METGLMVEVIGESGDGVGGGDGLGEVVLVVLID